MRKQSVVAEIRIGAKEYVARSISLLGARTDHLVGLAEAVSNVGLSEPLYL